MQPNMLTFDRITMLTFKVFRKLMLHIEIGSYSYINGPYKFFSVMLNMNIIFRQMFLECTRWTCKHLISNYFFHGCWDLGISDAIFIWSHNMFVATSCSILTFYASVSTNKLNLSSLYANFI